MSWDKFISKMEIEDKITGETVNFAKEFGEYLAKEEDNEAPLTTSQLRKFFGDVKRQQMMGYDSTSFVMLKPKLAYAVGRARQKGKKGYYQKIEDFYKVLSNAIDMVEACANKEKAFKNFITAFEAIVAYHKSYENN